MANGGENEENHKRKMKENLVLLGRIVGPILILLGLLISIYIVWSFKTNQLMGLGLVGLITFTFVLFGSYLITKKWNFGSGEFRKAITISILAVFFATLGFGDKIVLTQGTVLSQVFNNFWAILSTVVAFYFAARVVDKRTISQAQNNQQAQNTPPAGSNSYKRNKTRFKVNEPQQQ